MATKQWAIGVDLGGTKIEAALVNGNGVIEHRVRVKTDVKDGVKSIQKQLVQVVRQVLEDKKETEPVGVGIGVAGQIEKDTGKVIYAPNLNWSDVPLKENIENGLKLPVDVINDVRAAAWGEWLHGSGKNSSDMVCVFVGTGIGGGIVSGGRMLTGHSNSAGEIGHMTISVDGPKCHCGNRGCFEALAGGWAIAQRAQNMLQEEKYHNSAIIEKASGNMEDITAKMVVESYHEGDAAANHLMSKVTNDLASGLISMVNAFNPEYLVLGGGVIEGMPEMIDRVKSIIKERALKVSTKDLKVVPADLHNDSGVIGAAALAMQLFNNKK
ncbi:MAG TPA: ROK family protein [Balneolaceae bacterium]|nr:ROK family protein [Balneolales bacterium]HKK44186.1 ROK family protein [Balneolaceae bacterium]